MSSPPALLAFFQQEAVEYLDRLDQLLGAPQSGSPQRSAPHSGIPQRGAPTAEAPDGAAFLSHARALRGSAAMTQLSGLTEFTTTLERIAAGLRRQELGWDQRFHATLHGALTALRAFVERADRWTELDQQQARAHSVTLAATAAGYLRALPQPAASSAPVVPIARLFPNDGQEGIVHRNPAPPITLAERFRADLATAAGAVEREVAALGPNPRGSDAPNPVYPFRAPPDSAPSPSAQPYLRQPDGEQSYAGQPYAVRPYSAPIGSPAPLAQALTRTDALRRALLQLADVAESFGATAIATLAVRMARSAVERPAERTAIGALARTLGNRDLADAELATRVRALTAAWPHADPPSQNAPSGVPPAVVPIESLLYRGPAALARAREVRDALRDAWQRLGGTAVDPATAALLDELSDLLDLATTE